MATIDFKLGDTFEYSGQFKDATGNPVDMTGWTTRSQIRDKATKSLIVELTTSWLDITLGIFHLVTDADTTAWPVASLLMDIQLTDSLSRVVSTDTLTINVIEDVTK
ncbi:MAG TPA: hypothetical protein VJ654_03075 [Noviherbaspirillum sp.]|nr:hypothetical protein [Noviherbaspirillum sp.]